MSSSLLQVFVELGNLAELRTTSFIESTGVAYSDSVRTGDPRGFNKGRRAYRSKRCGNNNKDEDNSPKTLNDKKVFLLLHKLDSQRKRFLPSTWPCLNMKMFSALHTILPSHKKNPFPPNDHASPVKGFHPFK